MVLPLMVLLSDSSKPEPPVQEAVVAPKQPRVVDEAEELQVAHVPRAGSRGRQSEDSKVKRVQEPGEAKQAIEETDETHDPINKFRGKTRDEILAASGKRLVRKEFLWPIGKASFNNAHAATIIEVRRDELLCAFFGGSQEGANDVAIYTSRLEVGAEQWSKPEKVADAPNVPLWNPVLFKYPLTGEILLFYKIGPSPMTWSGALKRSADLGRTWSEPEMLPAGILGCVKNKPIYALEDNALMCPSSVESFLAWASWIEVTRDGGRSWNKIGPIVGPLAKGVIQPAIFFTDEGHIRAFMRSSREIGKVCVSTSYSGGLTWEEAKPTDILNPNSGFDVVKLTDGRVVMVHNTKSRAVLEVRVSLDDGLTWHKTMTLEQATSGEYSYAAVIQSSDGFIHVVYTYNRKTIKHAVLNPEEFY